MGHQDLSCHSIEMCDALEQHRMRSESLSTDTPRRSEPSTLNQSVSDHFNRFVWEVPNTTWGDR